MRAMKTTVFMFAAVAAILTFGCSGEEASHVNEDLQIKSSRVTIETVQTREIATMLAAVGTVHSKVSTQLSSRIMGYVTVVAVAEGDAVSRGQLLAEIDSRETATQLEKAEAGLEEARSAVEEIDRAISASESSLEAARANAALVESTYQRFKELLARKSLSQQEFDDAEAKNRAAQAEVRRSEEMLRSVEAKGKQVNARVDQAQANLANAQLHHSYARITSPLSGIVTSKSVEVGQLASPGVPLFTVEDGKHYRLDASVEESRIRFLTVSQKVPVRVDALDEVLEGEVSEVVPVSNPASRSFTVKIDLPFHKGLKSGLFGRFSFPGGTRQSLTVAASAIVTRGQLTGVFLADSDQKALFQLVKTGERIENRIEVLSGLHEGDRVVIQADETVRDGQSLSFTNSTPGGLQ